MRLIKRVQFLLHLQLNLHEDYKPNRCELASLIHGLKEQSVIYCKRGRHTHHLHKKDSFSQLE